ncbi:hypothetical protein [Puniceibacterium sediminis]|uniref:Uncharacterized protein n=1 Tax=Puniceibacterium sediminis TaxID=1608407 RepID=A0A238WGN9_9RHOB|nr:hypothetical protein [Puniceibacterium sediminis]SNR44839.1 hypothetical protein SAMN06265370_105150 [Puniceibacterium sediminis]
MIARVIDRLHLLIRCHICGLPHAKRVNVVLKYRPECPHCIRIRRITAATRMGASFLRNDPDDRHYGYFILQCGHATRRQYHRIEAAANGGHLLGCETCRELRYGAQSHRFGWTMIGPAQNGKGGYRRYRHTCGHGQDISIGNMVWGDCACAGCSTSRTARPSSIYLFRIDLPHNPVIKLGYSVRPAKRLRHQLGIAKTAETEVIRTIRLPTGHLARSEEERCHGFLMREHPEWYVPKAVYGDAINTVSEIYAPAAEARILSMLDDIEARNPAQEA